MNNLFKKTRLYSLFIGTLFFLFFILLTLFVRSDLTRSFDFDTTVRIQDSVPVRFDDTFTSFSLFGRFEFTVILLIIVLLFFYRKLAGITAFGLFGAAHIVELIGKTILSQPGPPEMFLRTTHINDFPGLYVHTAASYPSGHSLRTVFIGVLLLFAIYKMKKLPQTFKLFAYAGILMIIFLMLFSRVSLGEHWTTDVVGGALLAISFSFFSFLFL